jgi:hypothetical protein
MAADTPRVRRPAVWPWLVMPVIVLLVFCALHRVHKTSPPAQAPAADTASVTAPQRQ